MTLNLNLIAAEVVADSGNPDPGVMAEEMVARIPRDLYRDALVILSRSYIRSVISSQRNNANGGSPAQGSRKVAAARDAWKRLLNTPEFVPSAGWVFLRDATQAQVMEMAGERRKKSRELASAADRYTALADEMQKQSVMRVADLSDDTLEHLLEAAA